MTPCTPSRRALRWLGGLLVACLALLLATPALAGPGMPDPRQMSGIPRPDPQIPAGEVTVRVLLGGFDEPALGATVELELRSPDGRLAELRTETAGNQGRAHFRELGPFLGGQAVARVSFDGTVVRSQQIDLRPDAGTAVMLVEGATARGPSQEISLPGIVFPFEKTAAGTLMVGVFDLGARQGLTDLDVHLDVTGPDGQTTTRTVESGEMGQATFEGLADLPPGGTLQVRAQLDPEGEPYRSQTFSADAIRSATQGLAVVLAKGRMSPAGGNPHEAEAKPGQGQGGASGARSRLPAPQVALDLPPGTVQVMVVDGQDQPVPDYPVTIVKKDFSGTETRFQTKTDAKGVATKSDLPVTNDALYYAGVAYDGGPYTSAFFGLDARGGVRAAMRVWPVTSDPTVAQSQVQWEIVEGENDHAQIVQIYVVRVTGDEAFWVDGLRLEGLPGTKSLTVMRDADEWLAHEDEKAPFATLAKPIPPGEVVPLSVWYALEHDGEIELDWAPPFEVIDSLMVLKDSMTLEAPGATRSELDPSPQPGLDYTRVAYDLGQKGRGPVRAVVKDLLRTETRFRMTGVVLGVVMALVLALGLVLRPGGDTRTRLQRRRDALLAALEQDRSARDRTRIVTALDRIYRQLDALDALERTRRPTSPTAAGTGPDATRR